MLWVDWKRQLKLLHQDFHVLKDNQLNNYSCTFTQFEKFTTRQSSCTFLRCYICQISLFLILTNVAFKWNCYVWNVFTQSSSRIFITVLRRSLIIINQTVDRCLADKNHHNQAFSPGNRPPLIPVFHFITSEMEGQYLLLSIVFV